ncbi:MAG: ATP-binding protein, partial [Chloroflexota bacterium]
RGSYSPGADSYDATFDRVRNAEILILDDLGVENPSEWAKEKLFQLLNHRYNKKLPTVVTTNVDIDILDPRLRSRMLDTDIVRHVAILAPDYRTAYRNDRKLISELHLHRDKQLNNFDLQTGLTKMESQQLKQHWVIASDFAEKNEGWLLLSGDSGTGKTHLAAAIANAVQNQGRETLFLSTSDLLDELRRTYNPDSSSTFTEVINHIKNVDFLVMDDLKTTANTREWARENLVQIIKYRYLTKGHTVFTVPVNIETLENQIQTRIMDFRLCQQIAINVPPYIERLKSHGKSRY